MIFNTKSRVENDPYADFRKADARDASGLDTAPPGEPP
jgi:hypothetical protein